MSIQDRQKKAIDDLMETFGFFSVVAVGFTHDGNIHVVGMASLDEMREAACRLGAAAIAQQESVILHTDYEKVN